jgi:hypothetical protein
MLRSTMAAAPVLTLIGQTVREIRIERGMTQQQLADLCELHRTSSSPSRRDGRTPPPSPSSASPPLSASYPLTSFAPSPSMSGAPLRRWCAEARARYQSLLAAVMWTVDGSCNSMRGARLAPVARRSMSYVNVVVSVASVSAANCHVCTFFIASSDSMRSPDLKSAFETCPPRTVMSSTTAPVIPTFHAICGYRGMSARSTISVDDAERFDGHGTVRHNELCPIAVQVAVPPVLRAICERQDRWQRRIIGCHCPRSI